MAFDVAGAYRAGYSDAEIADYLAQQVGFDTNAARQSGYSDRELVNYLAANQPEGGFGAAFESGVEGVKSAGAALAGRLGLMDPQEAEQYMAERELAQRMAFAPTEEGWTEAPFTKVAELAGQSLPYMAAPVAGAAAGALALKTAPAWLAAGVGSTALSSLQFTGTNLQRQMEQGVSLEETDLLKAGATAVPQALLDTVALRYIPGVRRIFGEIGKDITEEQAKKIIERGILANMGAAGAKTASAEALTEVGQQALERFQAGLEVLDEEGRNELAESAIGGGVLGFLFGVPGAVGVRGAAENRIREATDKRYAEEQRKAEQEAEQQAAQIGPQPPATPTVPETVTPEVRQLTDYDRALFEGQFPPTEVTADETPAPPGIRQQLTDYDRALFEAQFPPTEVTPEPTAEVTPEPTAEVTPTAPTTVSAQPSPEIESLVGQENRQELEAIRAAREEEQRIAQLRLDSDIAELDASIQAKEQKTAQDRRLGLLLPIIENPNISSIPSAFNQALKDAGIRDTEFTERERNLIQRAQDVREAKPAEPETVPSTPDETQVESLIPERREGRTPEQLGLPGVMGRGAAKRLGRTRPVTEPEPVEVEAEPSPIVDEQALDTLKLPKSSMIRKRLIGKDLNDPAQRQQVTTELQSAVNNTRLPKETRDAIRDVLEQSEFTRQGEMFGPRGGILPGAIPRAGAPDARTTRTPTAAEPAAERPTGEPSVGVAGMGDGTTAAQAATPGAVTEPERAGLASTDAGVEPDTGRGEAVPSAVADPVAQELETNPAVQSDPFAAAVNQLAKDTEKKKGKSEAAKAETEAEPTIDKYTRARIMGDLGWGPPGSKLTNVDALPLQNRLDETIISQLSNNNLVGALNELAGRLRGPMATLAKTLANRVGSTRVVLVDDSAMRRRIFERTGKVEPDVKGVYFGADDTIFINTEFGLDAHTLLHESTHSLVDKVLNNAAHPLTKQLKKLFDDVKGGLDTAYGATDLKEFAAEFMSNPEFRAKLDRLHPGGSRVSALQKIVNAVMNFLRGLANIPQKKVDTAFSTADNLIHSIIEPGQTALQPTTTVKEASFLREGDKPIAAVPFVEKALPFLSQEKRDNIDEFMRGKAVGSVKKLVKASLPINALVDVAKNVLPSANRVEELIRQQSGAENMRRQMIEPIEQEAAQFAKKASTAEMTLFNDVVYGSTTESVDPTKPQDTYKGDKEKLDAWDEIHAKWKKLSPEGKKLYARMRDTYKKLYEDILSVIDERLNSISADPETSKKVKKDILAKLKDEAGKIDPYFPLTREGDYWISYSVQGEGVEADFVVEAFTTPAARDREVAALRDDPNVSGIEFYAKNQPINYANAPSGSFMNSVFTVLNANKVDPEVTQQMMTLFLNSLPASSFAQSFRRRKNQGRGVTGYKRDAVGAFRSKVYSIARQLSNIEYSAKLNDAKDQIIQESNEAYRQGNVAAREYADEFVARINYAVNPQVPRWSQALTSYGFLATLGFNLSSAVVNLSQIPLMVMPYYGGKYGYGNTASAIGRATKLYTNSGFSQDRVTILGDRKRMRVAPSIQNYNFDDPNLPNYLKPYKYLVEVGEELGQMNRSQVYDILEVGQNEGALTKVNKYSGFIFHHGERMNREVALAAAYDLEMQKKRKDLGRELNESEMRDAAREAVYMTEMTNGGIAATAAPRIAQNALGRVMFMYKRYGVSMYYTLFKMTRDMLRGESPEVRAAARAQIGGVLLSSVMLAGAQGLPLYGTAALIYNLFKEDDEDDADTEVRKFLGEGLYKGPVNLLLGVDVASRIGLSDLLFRANPVQREQEPMAEIMELIGGPVYSVANRALRGVQDIREGEVQRGVEQILPSAFGNVLKTLRFATEGVNTRRGDPIIDDIGFASGVGQLFGFAPADYIRQLEINAAQKGLERNKNERRSKLMKQYYMAVREGDAREAQQVMEEIGEFNQRNPAFAVTADSLRRSMRQHARTTSQMYGGVTYSKRYMPEFMEAMREYEGE